MGTNDDGGRRPGVPRPSDLLARLNALILAGTGVTDLLSEVARLGADVVPATATGITFRGHHGIEAVLGHVPDGAPPDRILPLLGSGPSLEALRTGRRIVVADLTRDPRGSGSDGFGDHAEQLGIRSVVAVPLVADDTVVAALSLFGPSPRSFETRDLADLDAFTRDAAHAVTIAERQADRLALDEQLQEALATRALIDQALGILMHARRIGSREAFGVIREISQASNRKISDIAAEVIRTMTGHDPEPTRPLTRRGAGQGAASMGLSPSRRSRSQ